MKKRIAIVAGGDSSEHVVSLRSAQGIWSFLNHDKYETYMIVMKGKDWRDAMRIAADYTAHTIRVTLDNPKKPWYGVDFEATIPELIGME